MPRGFGINQVTGKDIAKISKELRTAGNGKVIRKQLSRELRAAAAPILPAVRKSIDQIPSKSIASNGLRARMKKATRLSVITVGKNATVSVLVDPDRMPNGQKALPAYMEGTKPRWRHPVYGNDTWVSQKAHPYFYGTVRKFGAASKAAVLRAVNKATKQII